MDHKIVNVLTYGYGAQLVIDNKCIYLNIWSAVLAVHAYLW